LPSFLTSSISSRGRAGACYFFFQAAIGCIGPLLYLAYRRHGLSAAEIGLAIAVAHCVQLFAGPLWGSASDVLVRRSGPSLVVVACLGAGSSILVLRQVLQQGRLTPILLLVAVWSLFAGAILPLLDSATLGLLGENQRGYGRVRVWGCVGFAMAALLVGRLGGQRDLDVLFPLYAALLVVCAAVAVTFPRASVVARFPFRAALRLMRGSRMSLFLVGALLLGISDMAWYGTLSLYLDDLGASVRLTALVLAVSSLSEIPLVATASWWLGRLGPPRTTAVAFAGFAFLWLGFSFIARPEMALVLIPLRGFSNGLYQVSGVIYVAEAAPPGYAGLAQGTFRGINSGLGPIIGSAVGGALFQSSGGAFLYRLCALLAIAAIICTLSPCVGEKQRVQTAPESMGQAGDHAP
jgi:PPP family 3-phenylpropionic acid transporter